MKMLKKLSAVILAICLVFSLTACHGKDEVALTINGVEIKSGLYMLAMLEADSEARQTVDTNLSNSGETASTTDTGETDYMSQTVEGLAYEDYVKNLAIEKCKVYAFYQTLINNKTISLTSDELATADSYAAQMWSYYGATYEANSISFDTYKTAIRYSYYANEYFNYLYDEGGEKEVSKEERQKYLTENFQLVYVMSTSYEDGDTDDEKSELKKKYDAYAERLKKGESFAKIYKEEYPDETASDTTGEEQTTSSNASTEVTASGTASSGSTSSAVTSSNTSSAATSSTATSSEEAETAADSPKDEYATPIVDPESDIAENYKDTSYYTGAIVDENYADISEMKKGEVKVVVDDESGVSVYVKLDITEDPYYLKAHNANILSALKGDEFDEVTKKVYNAYTVEENSYAINRFDVEDLEYPTASDTAN